MTSYLIKDICSSRLSPCSQVCDVLADDGFVSSYSLSEIPLRREVLPDEVALPLAECSRDIPGALALDVTDDLRDRVLRE